MIRCPPHPILELGALLPYFVKKFLESVLMKDSVEINKIILMVRLIEPCDAVL